MPTLLASIWVITPNFGGISGAMNSPSSNSRMVTRLANPVNRGSSPSVSQTPFPLKGVAVMPTVRYSQSSDNLAKKVRYIPFGFVSTRCASSMITILMSPRRCADLAIDPMVATITSASCCFLPKLALTKPTLMSGGKRACNFSAFCSANSLLGTSTTVRGWKSGY